MVVHALGRTAEGLRIGRDAVAAWRSAVRAPGAEATWPGEMATTLTDVAVMLGNAGEVDEATGYATEAVTILRSGRPVDTAGLATALHNVATTTSQRAMLRASADAPDQSVATLREATTAADEAIGLRESLSRRPDPIHRWELANSLLLRGRLHTILGDIAAGQRDLERALEVASAVGAGDLLAQAQLNIRMLRARRLL